MKKKKKKKEVHGEEGYESQISKLFFLKLENSKRPWVRIKTEDRERERCKCYWK